MTGSFGVEGPECSSLEGRQGSTHCGGLQRVSSDLGLPLRWARGVVAEFWVVLSSTR